MQWEVTINDKCVARPRQYSSGSSPSFLWSQNSLNELMKASEGLCTEIDAQWTASHTQAD